MLALAVLILCCATFVSIKCIGFAGVAGRKCLYTIKELVPLYPRR